jgi:hypothetical protein
MQEYRHNISRTEEATEIRAKGTLNKICKNKPESMCEELKYLLF